ncbi:MAG: transglycosylase domain-containing protein [Lachnospiraceae bacterium]|nr:transglycosylase domain-containing protein [Lachnospiraceae bacterium]
MNFNERETKKRIKALVSKPVKYQRKFLTWFASLSLLIFVAFIFFMSMTAVNEIKAIIKEAPDIDSINVNPTGFASTICDQNGVELQKLSNYKSNREEVALDQVPNDLQNAFIAIEDSRFYQHKGIDLQGITRAGIIGIISRDFSQGASTITQQLLKNNVFGVGGEASLFDKFKRKLKEQYLAIQLEEKLSKKEILEAYLNTINLGQGTLGVQAASKFYFDKDVSELTLSECAVIASITQNPTRYDPLTNPQENASRRQVTLKYMLNSNMISEEDYETALEDDVYTRIEDVKRSSNDNSSYSYFVDSLINQVILDLEEKLGYNETQAYNALYSEGLTIYSTEDTTIQEICDKEFNNPDNYLSTSFTDLYGISYQLSVIHPDKTTSNYQEADVASFLGYSSANEMLFSNKKDGKKAVKSFKKNTLSEDDKIIGETLNLVIQPQISFSMIDQSTGYVVALVGGRGQKSGNLTLNRATDTLRQPGSTFKILSTFAPALDSTGLTLGSVYDDAPYNYENSEQAVNNYYTTGYRGLSTIRDAIRDSMNIVTAKCMVDVTPQVGYNYLINMGFTSLVDNETDISGKIYTDIQQSLCLGGITKGVSNLELTAAYATIANGGSYNKPILYTKIVDHDGNVLIENENEETRVMKDTTAWLLTDAMKDVVSQGTAVSARLATPMAVAGKTGTTSDNFDHWFVGYTPYYTAGIWAGNDYNRTIITGSIEKAIWAKIMNQVNAAKMLKDTDFEKPDNIVAVNICRKSGKLAVNGVCNHDPRGTMVRTEYYVKGTEPTESCDVHTKISVCNKSNLPASEYCPKDDLSSRIYITRPKDSVGITSDSEYELPKSYKKSKCNIHLAPISSDAAYATTEPATTVD